MNTKKILCCLMLCALVLTARAAETASRGKVITWPAPAGEATASDYRVEVNGQAVDVYRALTQHHDKQYFFASFDFSGAVTVKVTSQRPIHNLQILPERYGIKPQIEGDTLTFTRQEPFRISIERDGENSPLLLFGNPPERDAPRPGAPNVVYYGPGIHKPNKITLTSGQTLYLAGGAVVKGAVIALGENITLRGRGILDGTDWPHTQGPAGHLVHFNRCRNVAMEGVVLRGSYSWTVVPEGCEDVRLSNVKICGSRVGNDDGIDPVNSSGIVMEDCFFRTDDDCVAMKGMTRNASHPCEKITIKNCAFWTDRANIFRIGFESEAPLMGNLLAEAIDVLHFAGNNSPEAYWSNWVITLQPSDNMPMRECHFKDFRIHADGNNNLVQVKPIKRKGWGWDAKDPGRVIEACTFEDFIVDGQSNGKPGIIQVTGADTEHNVRDIGFKNVQWFGKPIGKDSPGVKIGPFTAGVNFDVGK